MATLTLPSLPAPECNFCGVRASATTKLASCSRCLVTFYCCRGHQEEDFADHRFNCGQVHASRAWRITREAKIGRTGDGSSVVLGNERPKRFQTNDLNGAGVFVKAKCGYIQSLAALGTPTANVLALQEALDANNVGPLSATDSERLRESVILGVREGLPVLVLLQGKLQECYDYLKWWIHVENLPDYDIENPTLPFLDIHGADMTEPMLQVPRWGSAFLFAALTYIKMALAKQVKDLIHARAISTLSPALPAPAQSVVDDCLLEKMKALDDEQLQSLQYELEDQASAAFRATHSLERTFWETVLHPDTVLRERLTTENSRQMRMWIKQWLKPFVTLWRGHTAFLREQLRK